MPEHKHVEKCLCTSCTTSNRHHIMVSSRVRRQLGKTEAKRQSAYRALFRGRMPERDLEAIREAKKNSKK